MENAIKYIQDFLLAIEIISAIVAAIYFNKYKHTALKFILPYLWMVVLIELGAISYAAHFGVNQWLFNVLGLIEFTLIFYIYYRHLSESTNKKLVVGLWILFYSIFLINLVFIQKTFLEYNSNSFSIGSLFVAVAIVLYFKEILNTDKVLYLRYMLISWISAGLLFYHIGSLPVSSIINQLREIMGDSAPYLTIFLYGTSIIMYLSFILGFVWSKKEHNY